MAGGRGLLNLAPGSRLRLNGVEWTVDAIEPQTGRFTLSDGEGRTETHPIRWLIHHPDARPVTSPASVSRPAETGQSRSLEDLTPDQLERARIRAEHVLEAATGFRDGRADRARPGEPRPAYDPATTTLGQRREAKVAECRALPRHEAARLGLQFMGYRTLEKLTALSGESLLLACADGRWTRRSGGHRSVTEEVRQAIFAVKRECGDRSTMPMTAKHRLVHQFMAETFKDFPTEKIPSRMTLTRVWAEWFGPGGARARYARSAQAAAEAGVGRRMVVYRPGQVVALDSTPLPVKLRDSVFAEPVSATLTLALDLYTHAAPAFRLTLASDTAVDVAMLLRDVMLPLPMREGWGEDMAWPYPGVPAEIVTEFAGHEVAALPFFAPETVTTDHGGPYKSHDLVEVERVLGCNILPARTFRPSDKFAVERAFLAFNTMLFQHLLGSTGSDVADRGKDPEADAVLTREQMEHLVATFIVRIWQNHKLGEYAPAWGPGEDHSPNSLFAAAMQQGGWSMQIPEPELYYQVLRKHHVMIHPRRGVKILGLWYFNDVLDEDRFRGRSSRGGKHKGKWVVHSDQRDRRQVFFQDPDDPGRWHELRWIGLPPEGEVPAFSDKTAAELLDVVRQRKLAPRSDAELLPLLVELLSATTPVAQWPTQIAEAKAEAARARKRDRTARAREAERGQTSRADRERGRRAAEPAASPEPVSIHRAVDASRRQRREAADLRKPVAPPRLDDALRRRGMFLLPSIAEREEPEATEESM
ncbi:transposase [Streptomyces sp. MUM 16J]|uniref:transposase n=2 Tax=unclassified Streptomyces TaxID=2593676 RepID=UPI001F03B297|nr:transposase [Streptomyces sp. MUM 16J]MCH0561479.1 transposase [Streptomyces sp. MUM 16J]